MPEFVTAHQDLWILGTYNDGNYRGMGEMNEAFINRFRHIRWDYDEDVEAKLIVSPAIRLLGEALRNARKANTKGFRTPVGTAALMRLEEDVAGVGRGPGPGGLQGHVQAHRVRHGDGDHRRPHRQMLQEERNQAELNEIDYNAEIEDMLQVKECGGGCATSPTL